jgi:methyl-accepting chemotaxis protein
MNLKNLKISTRLTLGFASMAVLIALLGAVALYKMEVVGSEFTVVIEDRYPMIALAHELKEGNNEVAQAVRNLFLMTAPAEARGQFAQLAASIKRNQANLEQLTKSITRASDKQALEKLASSLADYVEPRDRLIALLHEGKMDEAKGVLLGQLMPRQMAYMARIDELIGLQDEEMKASSRAVESEARSTEITVAALLALAFALAGVLGVWIVRSTTRPINDAVKVAHAVAAGDLALAFEFEGTNETAQLLRALHDMQTRLAATVGEVRRNAEGVASASAQIAQGNIDLSGRTEEQASALEETAASMEELSSTVRQNADNARQANQLALGASGVAVQGGEVVGEVVETMKDINASSKRIADIIGVIDSIAFQTNILALNAAVEAARAGEQGRGFAVVASEVRSLAQRSAEAAKEIKGLITASVERVEQGNALVDRAGVTMQEVVASIRRVTDIVGEISAASAEQSAGVAQVGEAVVQMDQATQQNAALVEESAAAAESLKLQARQLVDAVAVFKLASSDGAAAAVHRTPDAPIAPTASTAPARAALQRPAAPAWNGAERRGPDRACNVVRPAFATAHKPGPAAAAAVTTATTVASSSQAANGADDWESF